METILFICHPEADNALSASALESLSAARSLAAGLAGAKLCVGLVGANVQPAANQIAGCGAARFFGVSGAEFAPARYATDAAAAEALARAAGATLVLAPAGSRWNRALPGVARRLGGRVDSHVTTLAVADGQPAITAGNQLAGRDPAYLVVKTLSLVLVRDGKREELSLAENQAYDLLTGKTPAAAAP